MVHVSLAMLGLNGRDSMRCVCVGEGTRAMQNHVCVCVCFILLLTVSVDKGVRMVKIKLTKLRKRRMLKVNRRISDSKYPV